MYKYRLWCTIHVFILVIIYINGRIITIPPDITNIRSFTDETKNDITITSDEMITRDPDGNITSSENTPFTSMISYATMETSTTTPEICTPEMSYGIDVIMRNSSSFKAFVTYNCSSINSSELSVFSNETEMDSNCHVIGEFDNGTISITCQSILNNAGRDWTFTIVSKSLYNQIIFNTTFTITFEPLSLDTLTNISIIINDDLTSGLVYIPNCLDITDLQYLIFRCDSSDLSNNTLSNNCTYECFDLQPGSIYEASLIRLPVPIADKDNQTFLEENLDIVYRTNLDKVANLTFITDNTTATIFFTHPRGNFDQINLTCITQDQHCSNFTTMLKNTTENCSTCTSMSIAPLIRGVRYLCQTLSIKDNFTTVPSNELNLTTALEPIIYEKSEENWSFSTSHFDLNVTEQSDFDYLQSNCIVDANLTFPCLNLMPRHNQCSTILEHNGTLGCTYHCSILTKKFNYDDKSSKNYTVILFPPIPVITQMNITATRLFLRWEISEPAYITSFDVFLNDSYSGSTERTVMFHEITSLLPNRKYQVRIRLNANRLQFSNYSRFTTLEAVPKVPSDYEIENKILVNDNDAISTSTEHVIAIDRTLFSDENGFITNYSIYIRQDQNKIGSSPDLAGTYDSAWQNSSIDYLAFFLPRSLIENHVSKNDQIIHLFIGNETSCTSTSIASIPCNGKLKPNTNYSLIIRACNQPGCTSVRSKAFRTKNQIPPIEKGTSSIWLTLLIVPALIIVLLVWKRKSIRKFYEDKSYPFSLGNNRRKIRETPVEYRTQSRSRPKPLRECIKNDERTIYAEFEELESTAPSCRPSKSEPDFAEYNRYTNIPARGQWKKTAVCLTGSHRRHDYINANIITSYDKKKTYIACQGPLENTCEDFWDMILQFNIQKIVMLTKTEEPNRQHHSQLISKCYPYFPMKKNKPLKFGETILKLLRTEYDRDIDLEIRYISIKQNGIEHHVNHYFFTGWPDFKVVEPSRLLDIIETINLHNRPGTIDDPSIPMVIHCSAGVGRTGTYIAVETILRLLDRPRQVLSTMELDIMGIVYQMRQDRVKMVQTKEQYMLIYRCVEEHLQRTNRLDLVLRSSHVGNFPMKNEADNLSESSEPYVNLRRLTNERIPQSTKTTPSHYINVADQRPIVNRSYSVIPDLDTHSTRSRSYERRSTHVTTDNTSRHKTKHRKDRDSSPPPPLLPRRSISTQSHIRF